MGTLFLKRHVLSDMFLFSVNTTNKMPFTSIVFLWIVILSQNFSKQAEICAWLNSGVHMRLFFLKFEVYSLTVLVLITFYFALFLGLACFKPGLDLNSTGTSLGIGLDFD